MTDRLCSFCKLFGKPKHQVNVIVSTGVRYSTVYKRIKYLMESSSDPSSIINGQYLTTYKTMEDINGQLFELQQSSVDDLISTSTETCCNGYISWLLNMENKSSSVVEGELRNEIDILLNSRTTSENGIKHLLPSWILCNGPMIFKSEVIKRFLLLDHSDISFTIYCFLVDEDRFFENWLFENQPLERYKMNVYPNYHQQVSSFFELLDSSSYLQKSTLLVEEKHFTQHGTTLDNLLAFLQDNFNNDSSEFRASNNEHRSHMAKLLSSETRTIRHIREVRSSLVHGYLNCTTTYISPLLSELQHGRTANKAARKIINLILRDFEVLNTEEKNIYKRLMILGLRDNKEQTSDTIAIQLVHYALKLLESDDDENVQLIHSIGIVLNTLSWYYFFSQMVLDQSSEIFKLSLLLISKRNYMLSLSGLLLCKVILDCNQSEYKYAMCYLNLDPLAARKILDAIIWLLSPFKKLTTLWKEKSAINKDNKNFLSTETESIFDSTLQCCISHTEILTERSYLSSIANLFYDSIDHCQQVTVDDVDFFLDIIDILAEPRIFISHSDDSHVYNRSVLISGICALLMPILQYTPSLVSYVLVINDELPMNIAKTIGFLIENRRMNKDSLDLCDLCVSFYAKLIRMKFKEYEYYDLRNKEYEYYDLRNDDEETMILDETTSTHYENILTPLDLTKDLVSSYFDLYKRIQQTISSDEKPFQQAMTNELLMEEWQKIDNVQSRLAYEEVMREKVLLNERILQLEKSLDLYRMEQEQLRKQNKELSIEIDNAKRISSNRQSAEPPQLSLSKSIDQNNPTDTYHELEKLTPSQITQLQAEEFIRAIYHRRTTFNDSDMRESICGSLKHLGSDLYSSPVHFLYELIQNAEDNFYDDTVLPRLRIELDHGYILFSNNEQGFRAQDVQTICRLAVTTKTNESEHIGEKGVGFKSVFAASNQPMLLSHAWKFYFQVPGVDAMSYITPLWATESDIPDYISEHISKNVEDTHIYLPLKLQPHTSEANEFLDQIIDAVDPCILLNLNKLKRLEINDKRYGDNITIEKVVENRTKLEKKSIVEFENFTFYDMVGSMIRLNTTHKCYMFRVYTCRVNVPTCIEQKRGSNTRLIMAFPCNEDKDLTNTVYTGLPVCDLGLNFLVNADFQLVTNRENVREDLPFNTFIRDNLSALFVYLMINDEDLRQDLNRYCPSTNEFQKKHSLWWLAMINNINQLLTKYLPILFDIEKGKKLRYSNNDLTSFVSKEQLYNCANIHVIDMNDPFLTRERLIMFKIEPVTIVDILHCFPSGEETSTNEFRQQFYFWTQKQNPEWWCRFFNYVTNAMTKETSQKLFQLPIFLYRDSVNDTSHRERRYLPIPQDGKHFSLFVSDDPQFQIWKRQLILLQYCSIYEKNAFLKTGYVQLLTDERLIEIIRHDHLQLAASSSQNKSNIQLIDEIWKDLFYLQSHLKKIDKNTLFLVPVNGKPDLVPIQNAKLPSIFGVNIEPFIYSNTASAIQLPYGNNHDKNLSSVIRWEYFLLEMHCQRPSIRLPQDITVEALPILPALTMFTNAEDAQLAELIFSHQNNETKNCLRQFPIVDVSKNEQQICPISCTFDRMIVQDLPTLPSITIPTHCRSLALKLGICMEYDVRTCVTVLKLLTEEKNTNVDLYIKWLSHLQLQVRQQHSILELDIVRYACQLYLPDQDKFYSFSDLLIMSTHEKEDKVISIIAKYLKLQLISPFINQIYWQFKNLFDVLNCLSVSTLTINHICTAIYHATLDKSNFFAVGDCNTTLTEDGLGTMIILYQYLEELVLKAVKTKTDNTELYDAVIKNKHPTAVCGSREDLEWRLSFTCNQLSKQLRQVAGFQSQPKTIGLITVDRQIVKKTADTIIFASLETSIIDCFGKNRQQRHFILPSIARTCPLVLAAFDVNYIEGCCEVQWIHINQNFEYSLSELTEIFCNSLDDPDVEVITSNYARVNLLHSYYLPVGALTDQIGKNLSQYPVYINYPFWVFDKIVLLCVGNANDDTSRASIAASALSTMLHKRKHMPIKDAKLTAKQQIRTCKQFRSTVSSKFACAPPSNYSCTEIILPMDHQSNESMITQLDHKCSVENDAAEQNITNVALDRIVQDDIYHRRMPTIDHRNQNIHHNPQAPHIVDSTQQTRVGQWAEHFFFVFLQYRYGCEHVTPTWSWRSSSRLCIYPNDTRNVNDSTGFDFELYDTKELFVRNSGAMPKYCYFEVKGVSGPYIEASTEFHISHHEFDMCNSIASSARKKSEAYIVVIIQNCHDPMKTCFGPIIEWSQNMDSIQMCPDSYSCKYLPSSFTDVGYVENQAATVQRFQRKRQSSRPYQSGPVANFTGRSRGTKWNHSMFHNYDSNPPYDRNQYFHNQNEIGDNQTNNFRYYSTHRYYKK